MAFDFVDVLLALGVAVGIYVMINFLTKGKKAPAAATKPESLMKSSSADASASASAGNKDGKTRILFLFGSQSGTAENYAYDLAEEGKQYGFDCEVMSLGDFNVDDLAVEKFIVFLAATFGEGEPTDDAAAFWRDYITKPNNERTPNELDHLLYSVFALGNRQYRHFCAVGRRIDTEMAVMKAERLLPVGLGDDDGTLAEDFENWRQAFWAAARLRFMGETTAANDITFFQSQLDVTFFPRESEQATKYQGGLPRVARFFHDPAKDHKTMILPVVKSYELRQDTSDGTTVHVEFSLSAENQSYRTAENLGVHPRNDYKLAGKLAKRMGLSFEDVFAVSNKGTRKLTMPTPCSVGDLFLYFADINSLPRHKHAGILSAYAKDEKEKAKLLYFASDAQGKEEFNDLKYNWVELLEAFPSIDIPFAHLIELIPRLQPRYYTISSSSKVSPRQLAITVSRFTRPKPNGREHIGTCSDYICKTKRDDEEKKAEIDDKMVVFIRNSSFRLPLKAGTPIIMIGPGTGIAPFRGFIQEFRTRTGAARYGKTILYFGCRNASKDYIYREELEQAKAEGVLDELRVAFSRDGPKKVYVQDLLRENGQETWELINNNAYIYVCGGTAMGRDIRQTIVDICVQYGGMTPAAADTYVDRMARQNRYVQELWSS